MKNGIYALKFESSIGIYGAGSAEFEDGRIRGGDDEYLYISRY